MSIKTKITSLITTFVLLCSLLTVGVFAVKNTTFNVGGDIVFNVQGIEAEVKLEELTNASLKEQTYNTGADTDKLKTFELDNDMTASQVQACYESWAGLDMKFDSEADVLLKIRITNKTEIADNLLKVDMSATFGSANNCTISVDKATATINPGEYEIFTITFSITNKEYSANIENFAVNVNMSQAEPFKLNMKYDEENNYYYIEMGSYNGSPVRWRYVSDVTNGIDTAVSFDATSNNPDITSGKKGMFVQETVTTKQAFDAEYVRDYATSDIKTYLDTYHTTLNISEEDVVYSKIQTRTMFDLYKKIGWARSSNGTVPSGVPDGISANAVYDLTTESTESVSFWLMSVEELYRFVGKGIMEDNIIPYDWSAVKGNIVWNNQYYWLRFADLCSAVDNSGSWREYGAYATLSVRPAFILEF